ncbi:MAG: methyltransferase domain-containing protein [Ruminococcus sp.]|jgi:ubiquinone/menaquinone biosynthesis C-methylase UbiE/predicted deacylase
MTELLKEIETYWSTRTEGYSEVNQKELAGMQKKAWLSVLEEQFPRKKKEEISILDVGTGPGFFPVILAETGYRVTAVDYTEGMLEKARENAKDLAEKITFLKMDGQNLTFDSESFDVVISRNLTWNLENPERAYKEWCRVLKPGGVLLNFDANWYGYLYDEEKRKAYEQDRKNVEAKHLDDHYLGTDIDAMESIARRVPLSGMSRPKWDLQILRELGMESVQADEDIWKCVWSEEEKLNYGSTPMFMITGRKKRKTNGTFHLLNMEAQAGERVSGYLELDDGEFRLPVSILHGSQPGKTVLITAGIHAGEYVGVQAAVELSLNLNPEKIAGTVIVVKVVNRPAFENRAGSLGLEDGKNLNRVFPGDPQGTEMERLAWAIDHQLFSAADFLIDLHSGDDYERLTPYVYYAGKASPAVVEQSRKMAEQVDVPYMVKSNVSSGGAYNYAAACGIPSILIERGGMGQWTREEVSSTRRDVRNILCHLGVYLGRKDYRKYYPLDVTDVCYQIAWHTGLWYPFKNPGDMIQKGEVLGEVRDYSGKVMEVCRAESDGVILYCTGSLQVLKDGPMIAYGRIVKNYDDRKVRITKYWGKRSSSFLDQRRKELHSPLAGRWLNEIKEQIPGDRKLKILDVGCGTGFFTILLAGQGHQATGTDLTPEMVEYAKQLAREENAQCQFLVMDAENLEFEDETFDVVISRNLTWTLPHAEEGYREWKRVLKPGGILLNFDANYGADDCQDTSGLPQNHAHNRLGDEMMRECEEIKRQLPISSYQRPAWDLETLGREGFQKFSIDLGVSRRVYVEKDEFYNPVPLFMLRAQK